MAPELQTGCHRKNTFLTNSRLTPLQGGRNHPTEAESAQRARGCRRLGKQMEAIVMTTKCLEAHEIHLGFFALVAAAVKLNRTFDPLDLRLDLTCAHGLMTTGDSD